MFSSLLLSSTLVLLADEPPRQPAPDTQQVLEAYQTARANTGPNADAQVQLALWCEAHGLRAERLKHLATAVISNPKHAMARGLLGMVQYQGRWQRPEEVGAIAKADIIRAEYLQRRARTSDEPDDQWELANWCDQNQLKPEAAAHYTAVIQRDPKRDEAWRKLGYKKQGKRWVTDAQLATEKAEESLQKKADRVWKPLLETYRIALQSKIAERRANAAEALTAISDPRAVPMICALFTDNADRQTWAVQMLGQIDAAGASRALAMLATFGDTEEVRRRATETLENRDPREFADLLIGMIREPIRYQVKPVRGPGQPGELFIEGKQANVSRRYSPPSSPEIHRQPGDRIVYGGDGLPMIRRDLGYVGQISLTGQQLLAPFTNAKLAISTDSQERLLNSLTSSGLSKMNSTAIFNQISKLRFSLPSIAFIDGRVPYALTSSSPLSDEMQAARNFSEYWQASIRPHPFNPQGSISYYNIGQYQAIPIGQMDLEAQKTAAVAQRQLELDVESLKKQNEPINALNGRILPILKEVSGQDLGDSQEAWQKWWVDQIGYTLMARATPEKPTITEEIPLDYQPRPTPVMTSNTVIGYQRISCFGAGTLVHTLSGTQPIESLKVGDQVLTQNTTSGALGYQPILVVHRNPPSATYKIQFGDESIVSSHFHRFWKAGQGWVMARDLEQGDTVRTLGGLATISTIAPSEVQPVFNLDVAEDADFFVGRGGALVHDNTLPDLRQIPFDAPPAESTSEKEKGAESQARAEVSAR